MNPMRATPIRAFRMYKRAAVLLCLAALPGCFYVTKDEYDEAWDRDGDGFPNDEDCAPDDERIYPGAPDPRGDGCNSDCGVELDADSDDWPDDNDCYDSMDPTIYPCAPDTPGDGVDSDCDGNDDPRDSADVCLGEDPRDPAAPRFAPDDCPVPVTGVAG